MPGATVDIHALPDHDTAKVVFEEFGHLHSIAAFVHAKVTINLNTPVRDCFHTLNSLPPLEDMERGDPKHGPHKLTGKAYHAIMEEKEELQAVWRHTRTALRHTCTEMDLLARGFLHQQAQAGHDKRQLGVAAAFATGSAFGGLIDRLFLRHTNDNVEHHFQVTVHRQEELASMIQRNNRQLKRLSLVLRQSGSEYTIRDRFYRIRQHIAENRALVARLRHALAELKQRRLTLDLVEFQDCKQMLHAARATASAQGLTCPLLSPLDILQLPAAFTVNATTGTIRVGVFIPLSERHMPIHKFRPGPIALMSTTDRTLLFSIQPEHTLIAAQMTGSSFVTLDRQDLQACININIHFLCTDLIFRVRRDSTCISAAFSGNAAAIRKTCRIVRYEHDWHLSPRHKDQFVLTAAIPLALEQSCTRANSSQRATSNQQVQPGQYRLHVRPGCVLQSQHFLIRAANAPLATLTISRSFTWDIRSDVFDNRSNRDILRLLTEMDRDSKHTADDLRSFTQKLRARPAYPDPTWGHLLNWSLFLAAAAIAMIVTVALCNRHRRKRRTHETILLSHKQLTAPHLSFTGAEAPSRSLPRMPTAHKPAASAPLPMDSIQPGAQLALPDPSDMAAPTATSTPNTSATFIRDARGIR